MSYPGQEVYEALKVSKMKLAEHISVLSPQHTWRANLFQTWSVDGMFFERGDVILYVISNIGNIS